MGRLIKQGLEVVEWTAGVSRRPSLNLRMPLHRTAARPIHIPTVMTRLTLTSRTISNSRSMARARSAAVYKATHMRFLTSSNLASR